MVCACTLTILGGGALLVALLLIIYARWNFGKLEKQGIKVVEGGDFLLGGAMLSFQKCGGLLDIEHMRKYGPVFGLYEGREPQIFVCDAELIRLITTKDAEHFDSKRLIDFGDPVFNEMLDFQPLEKWRTMRAMFSPPFNSIARFKHSNSAMRESIQDFVDGIKKGIKEKGQNGRLERYCLNEGIYSMVTDLVARSQFSIQFGKGSSDRFVKIVRTLMTPPATTSPWMSALAIYGYAFPFLRRILPNTLIDPGVRKEFTQVLRQMMDTRRQQNKENPENKPNDYLDTVIEWYDDMKNNPAKYNKVGITEWTIYNLGIMVFVGSQDQFSLILSAMMNHVSKNPEIERRLEQEVDQVWEKNKGVITHEVLSDMPYLNACVLEATRMYPFFFRSERVCTKDWEDPSKSFQVKKGDVIQLATWAAHRNPEYFEDGEEFQPDRFLPGRKEKMHPYAFSSFGFGPRNCVGKRFAMEIMMLLMVTTLRHLRFKARKDTGLQFLPAGPFFTACEPIVFDVEERIHQK